MKHVDRTPNSRARGGRRRDIAADADGGAREVAAARRAPTRLA
ncbi:hypothetical protein [Burkholderia gladioli]|nr:hypothetical protein [Burkholderia gladioli]